MKEGVTVKTEPNIEWTNECKRCGTETAHPVYCPLCVTVLTYKYKVRDYTESDNASE